jgi:hypothetical protein
VTYADEIADAVVDLINAGVFTSAVSASTIYVPLVPMGELPASGTSECVVLWTNRTRTKANRDSDQKDFVFEIGIRRRVDSGYTNADVKPLVRAAEDVETWLAIAANRTLALPGGRYANYVQSDLNLVYSMDRLQNQSVLMSSFQATYRVVESEGPLLLAGFTAAPSIDHAVKFTETTLLRPGGSIASREWAVAGIGVMSTVQNPTIDFTGHYTLLPADFETTFTVTDDLGRTSSVTQTVTVSG